MQASFTSNLMESVVVNNFLGNLILTDNLNGIFNYFFILMKILIGENISLLLDTFFYAHKKIFMG